MPGKVLIVDDIATNRIVLKVQLVSACYQVIQASSGREALDLARRERPDTLICPLALQDMTGADLASLVRRQPGLAELSVLMLSSGRDPQKRWAAMQAGADDVLNKPVSKPILLARLRSQLRKRRFEAELNHAAFSIPEPGLAEAAERYEHPARIALIADQISDALRLRHALGPLMTRDTLIPTQTKAALHMLGKAAAPDALTVSLAPGSAHQGLALLADLRAQSAVALCGAIAIVPSDIPDLAAEALDRGADDVVLDTAEPRELALRLRRAVARRRKIGRLRANMNDGLRAAMTDPLTGLHNRRFAMPRLSRIADRAAETGRDFAVMIADLDHFKLINDRFGHPAGDQVLTEVATLIRDSLPQGALAARIGGEEFLMVLPDTNRNAALKTAQTLCTRVESQRFALPGQTGSVHATLSIGIAMGSESTPADTFSDPTGPDVSALLGRADRALYVAKAHGRNQAMLSPRRTAA